MTIEIIISEETDTTEYGVCSLVETEDKRIASWDIYPHIISMKRDGTEIYIRWKHIMFESVLCVL